MKCSRSGSGEHSRRLVLAALFAVAAASSPFTARATDYGYIGPNNGLWSSGGNWSPLGVPFYPADNVVIHPNSANDFTVVYDDGVRSGGNYPVINSLSLDPFGSGNAILNFSVGTANPNFVGTLTATQEIVGDFSDGSAAAIIQQTGGLYSANNVSTLILGNNAFGNGIYNLGANGTLNVTSLILGNQTSSSKGTLNLTGGTLNGANEQIGSNGIGVINQTGGSTHTVSANLTLGSLTGSQGTYLLDYYTASLSVNGLLNVGNGGSGQFTQANGNVTVGSLSLGTVGAGNGTYLLGTNNTGVYNPVRLTAGTEYVGNAGTGSFTQTAGTNTINGNLYVGYGGTGTYNISFGTSLPHLSASNIYLGYLAGSHGTLNATDTYTEAVDAGSVYVGGSAGQGGGTGVLTVGGNSTVNIASALKVWNTPGTVVNLSGYGSITTGTLDLSGNPSLLNWTGGSLTLTNSGLTIGPGGLLGPTLTLTPSQHLTVQNFAKQGVVQLTAGGTLNGSGLTADEFDQSGGTLNGDLYNGGKFVYTSGNFNGRLTNAGTGTIILNSDFTATDGLFNYSTLPFSIAQGRQVTLSGSGLDNSGSISLAGVLACSSVSMNGGSFQQSTGSSHTVSGNLGVLGGSYSLNQSSLVVSGNETIGSQADASFGQSGGGSVHTIAHDLQISGGGRGNALFSFSGGSLTVGGNTFIGVGGAGTFTQSGNPTFSGDVTVGDDAAGSGTYDVLSGTSTFQNLNIRKTGALVLESQPNPATLNGSSITQAGTLTVSQSAQINATMTFAMGSTTTIGNGATLTLNGASSDVGRTISGGGTLQLTGSASLSGAGVLALSSVQNAGMLVAKSGDLLIPGGTALTNSGTLQNNVGANLFVESGAVNHTGSIVTNAAGSVVFDQAITNNAGKSVTLLGGTLATPTLTNAAGGSVTGFGQITGNLVNQGSVSFYAPTQIVGNLTNAASGTFAVTNVQTVVTGTGLNQGAIHVTKGAVIFQGGLTNNGTYISDPSNNYFTDCTIGPAGSVSGGAGDSFYVSGDFTNSSTQSGSWNTSGALLGFQGGVSHKMNVAGPVGQFGWGTLQINSGDTVTVNGNSATAAATVNNGSLFHASGSSSLGAVTGNGTLSVGNSAGGSIAGATVTSFNQSSISINATGTLSVAPAPTPVVNATNNLTIADGGKLDLANHILLIHYAPGADPLPTIKTYLAGGYDNGRWDGSGIVSSAAAASASGLFTIGYADSADGVVAGLAANTIEVRYTLAGDVNLDGVVNAADAIAMARNWLSTGAAATWDHGNFNYDSTVNLSDAVLLRQNWNAGLVGGSAAADSSGASVPEPSVFAVAAAALLLRRGRRG